MGQDLVEIEPRELHFTFELHKQSSCSIHLVNKSNEYVAFKVKTTSPKRYCVRPNIGVVLPRSTRDFTVTMQAQKAAPPDMQLKDKFLVQTTVVPYGTGDEDLIPGYFSKETGRYVEENKLRVVLVVAPQPVAKELIDGVSDAESAVEVPVLKETLHVLRDTPHVLKEAPATLRDSPAPLNVIPPLKETVPLREPPAPLKETVPLREPPAPLKETVPLREPPVPLYETPTAPKESPAALKEASAALEELAAPLKEKLSPLRELHVPNDREFVKVENHQLSNVTGDVEYLKSKLNSLETKLEEAEKMIINMREESKTTLQERDKLQQDMVLLRRKGTGRNQAGFPLMFLVYMALLGVIVGYLLRI